MEHLPENIIPRSFYLGEDVLQISEALLGKYVITHFDGRFCAARIVETEAYRGPEDKASHAYNGRHTKRTEVMYRRGGTAYVYLCYGIHDMFNVVTASEGTPHAILVRAVEPVEGIEHMLARRGFEQKKPQLSAGPGVLCKALGITRQHTGLDLCDPASPIRLEDRGEALTAGQIIRSPRVGIDYAGEHAARPWRFRIKDNPWTSPAK